MRPEVYMAVFRMPTVDTIGGRSSTINAAFTKSIIPVETPTADEVKLVLDMLGMSPDNLRCAYCGDPSTEWDHFRPTVKDKLPTGYGSSIRNLVPACGKCNQSKGNKPWLGWMDGTATKGAGSPAHRGVPALADKIARLKQYDRWSTHAPLDLKSAMGEELWEMYQAQRKKVIHEMAKADKIAATIRERLSGSETPDGDPDNLGSDPDF